MRKIAHFILGNQLLEHDFAMLVVAFKWPALFACLLTISVTWWHVSLSLTDHEAYLVWMRIYAAGYMFLEFPPSKFVTITDPLGSEHLVPISILSYYPPVAMAWAHFTALLWRGFFWCVASMIAATALYIIISTRYGGAAAKVRHVRGALMVSADALNVQVKRLNLAPHKARLKALFGAGYRHLSLDERLGALGISAFRIAGIDYPLGSENRHTAIIGTTGSGKTQTLLEMVEQVRERGEKCVIFDLKGDFVSAFYDSKRDIILNPSDARCPAWSIFDECHTLSEFSMAADALIPGDASPSDSFWVEGARTMFTNYCMEVMADGKPTNEALVHKLMTAPLEDIYAVLKDTPAGVLVNEDTPRMGQSVRAVFNTNARGLQLLPSDGPSFSVRDWVTDPARKGSMIFLSTRLIDMPLSRQLLTLWIDTALITLMSGTRSDKTEMWFFVDEMAALHKLPSLKQALETSRSYGGAIVLGAHSNAQISETYGKDADQTILGLTNTKLFFAAADNATAKFAAEIIGKEEVIDVQHGATIGLNSMRDARSLSRSRTERLLTLPQEIMDLKRLCGFLKFSEGLPAAAITIVPRTRAIVAEYFIARPPAPVRARPDRSAAAPHHRSKTRKTETAPDANGAAAAPEETTVAAAQDVPDDGESGQQKQANPVRLGATAKTRLHGKGRAGKAPAGHESHLPSKRNADTRSAELPSQVVPVESRADPAQADPKARAASDTPREGSRATQGMRPSQKMPDTARPDVSQPGPAAKTGRSARSAHGPGEGREKAPRQMFKGPDELDFDQ